MSKDYIFNPGDFVVYPTHGVGQIKGIIHKEVQGKSYECIQIDFKKSKSNLLNWGIDIPIESAARTGLRQIVDASQMEAAIHILKGKPKNNRRLQWNKRKKEYETKINSGNLSSVAEVVRDLYRHPDSERKQNSERPVYESAMERFAAEYAALNKIDESEAVAKLESILQSRSTPKSSL